jgi:dTMP kinase
MIQPFEASGAVGGDDPPAWAPPAESADAALDQRALRIFGTPAFFRLWLAQVVSATGDWLGLMAITALAAAVSRRAEGVAVGLVLGARVAPGFFLAPWAGVLVDRWDRKKVMITCDLARAGVMIALPFDDSVPGLIVASLVLEVYTLLWSPAKEASVPNLVPKSYLTSANSLSLVAAYGTFPVGAGLLILFAKMAGWFADFSALNSMHLDRLGLAFYFNALTFLFTACIVWRLPIRKAEREVVVSTNGRRFDPGSTLRDLKEGWHFIFINPVVRAVNIGLACSLIGGGMLIPLGPTFVRQVLGAGDPGYGSVTFALGVGVAIGVVTLSLVQSHVPKEWLFTGGMVLSGSALIGAASTSTLTPAVFLVAFIGIGAGTIYVLGFTLLHENVGDALRGRVFTALYSLVRLCLLLAMAVGPFLSEGLDSLSNRLWDGRVAPLGFNIDVPGVRLTLWLAGLIILLAATLSWWSLRAGERRRVVIDLRDELADLEMVEQVR